MSGRAAAAVLFGEALVDDFGAVQVVGGAPFNVARHLAAFHVPQLMITRVGSDADGRRVRGQFERFGMADEGLQADPVLPTGRVLVREGVDGHAFTILPHQAYDAIDAAQALHALATVAPALLYFGTLAQREPVSRGALAALLHATTAPRLLDLNLRDGQVDERRVFASLQEADIVKVNEDELQSLFGWYVQGAPAGAEQGCRALVEMFELQFLVVTMGAHGAACFAHDGSVLTEPAAPLHGLADTVGAGDAFAAVFILGRMHGWPLALTLKRANAFAGAMCAVAGAVPDDPGFYADWKLKWGLVQA